MIYSYTKQANLDNLKLQIESSTITIALDSISLSGTNSLSIAFKASLSTSEETELTTIVNNHDHTLPASNSVSLVKIDPDTTPLVQFTPFADACGFRFRGVSFKDTVLLNETKNIDFKITEERWINGGSLIVDNIGPDDVVSFEVIDKDNVLGYGVNTVLDHFIDEFYIPQDGKLEVALAYPAKILQNLYVRLIYTSTHSLGCTVKCNLYLHLNINSA